MNDNDPHVQQAVPLVTKLPGFEKGAPLAEAKGQPPTPPSRPRFHQKPLANIAIFDDAEPWEPSKWDAGLAPLALAAQIKIGGNVNRSELPAPGRLLCVHGALS